MFVVSEDSVHHGREPVGRGIVWWPGSRGRAKGGGQGRKEGREKEEEARDLGSLGWPGTLYVGKDDPDTQIHLPLLGFKGVHLYTRLSLNILGANLLGNIQIKHLPRQGK